MFESVVLAGKGILAVFDAGDWYGREPDERTDPVGARRAERHDAGVSRAELRRTEQALAATATSSCASSGWPAFPRASPAGPPGATNVARMGPLKVPPSPPTRPATATAAAISPSPTSASASEAFRAADRAQWVSIRGAVINDGAQPVSQTFHTGLSGGIYCDVIHSDFDAGNGQCLGGHTVEVDGSGAATLTVPAGDAVAFHVNAVLP